jgi:uncharacterized protein
MSKAEPLYRLQLLDLDLDQARKQLAEVQQTLVVNAAVNHAKAELIAAQQIHRHTATDVKSLELEYRSLEEKLKTDEGRLYTGNIRNPKEMIDLQREVEILKRKRGEMDEVLLTAMLVLEEHSETEQRCKQALDEAIRHWEEANVGQREIVAQLQDRISADEERRQAICIAIPQADQNTYLTLRAKKPGGIAISPVKDSACSLCGEAPSSVLLQQVRTGSSLAACTGCGRILYFP